jgi:hypothetical protein
MDELPQVEVIRIGGKRLRLCAKCWTEMIKSEVGVSADKLKRKTPPRAGQASA